MKQLSFLVLSVLLFVACSNTRQMAGATGGYADTIVTESLFSDRNASISEENIQKILDGSYKLPATLRVSIVRLENPQQKRNYYGYWNDEAFLKTQQSYLDLFSDKFRQSPRVKSISIIPDLLISKSPSFTNIREAAVRMQTDIVVVYSVTSDIYSRYKLFSRPDIKAFATTQLIILDVRTGLVPFSAIVTRDTLTKKTKAELDNAEAAARVQNEAVLLTINEIGERINSFLNK